MKSFSCRFSNDSIGSLLLVNLGGLGDLLLATPFFREARRIFPRAEITLLCVAGSAPVLEGNPALDQLVALPGISPRQMPAALPRIWSLRRPDLLISMLPLADLSGALKFRLLHALLAPRHSLGLDTAGRGSFFSIPVYEAEWGQWNAVDNYLKLLGRLGGRTDIRHPELFLGQTLQSPLPDHPGRWVGIHPGASVPAKRWDADRFASAVKILGDSYPDLNFVITGNHEELELGQAVIRSSGLPGSRIINRCGQTDLPGLAALLRRLSLYLTNDTGSMHMAAALDVPLVAIFGPGDFRRFAPVSRSGRIRMLRTGVECAPCTLSFCSHRTCLETVSVEQAVDAACSLLDCGEDRG